MKAKLILTFLLVAALLALAQEPAKPEVEQEVESANKELERAAEAMKAAEMKAKLQELQLRLLSEKTTHEEMAKLAREYSKRALELQKTWTDSPERKAELAKMQFDLQKELSLAGLYKDRMMDFFDEKEVERNKQILALETKCMELSGLYKESKQVDKQKKIEQELDQVVGQLFDLREAQREKDIARMESDLARMKKKLEDRRVQKSQIIKKRMDQLLGKKDDLEW